MYKFALISLFQVLWCINNLNGLSLDSSNRFISVHLNKRILHSLDLNQTGQGYPFTNNSIYSIAAVAQKQIFSYKSFNLNAFGGITGQMMKIGRINTTTYSRKIDEPVNSKAISMSVSIGLSVEKRILKFGNHGLNLSVGLWGNGTVLNTVKTVTKVYERSDFLGNDSIVIDFKKNNYFYLNPFYQISLKSKLKKKTMITGVKLILPPLNEVRTGIGYDFYVTNFIPGASPHRGKFVDDSMQLILFWGINF